MNVLRKTTALVLVSSMLTGLLSSCGGARAQPDDPAFHGKQERVESSFPVIAVPVVRKTISEHIVADATLEAEKLIEVPAKSSGQVTGVFAEVGQRVAVGELLGRLGQREVLLEVKEAELNAENYANTFERTSELMKTTLVSKEEYDRQKYQLEVAGVKLQQARIKLENTEIRSPIDGIITARWIDVGATVSSNQKLFCVGDFDPLFAFIHIPERDISRLKINQGVTLSSESIPDEEFKGFIKRINPVVDSESGTIKVAVQVSAPAGRLKPGMFVTLQAPTETHPDVLVIPKKALVLEREQELVFVMKDGAARRTPLSLGLSDQDLVEVTSGLKEGDLVITVGQETLRDGSRVRPAQSGAYSESAAAPGGSGDESDDRPMESGRLSPEELKQLEERLLNNPQVKAEYEKRLKVDPELSTNPRKRAQFFKEQAERLRAKGN